MDLIDLLGSFPIIIFLVIFLFIIFIVILWIILPFIVMGLKNRVDLILNQLDEIIIKLQKISDHLSHIDEASKLNSEHVKIMQPQDTESDNHKSEGVQNRATKNYDAESRSLNNKSVYIYCSSCGSPLKISKAKSKKRYRCPVCNGLIKVPKSPKA